MDEPEPDPATTINPFPTTYPIPEATIAADPGGLAVVVAAILGVLMFWRRRKPDTTT
jgi:hypothetical protein